MRAIRERDRVRFIPDEHRGAAVLVLAGSSGRVDSARAAVLAQTGAIAESIRWFGGDGQHEGPWEIPLETFAARIDDLRRDSDRVTVLGTSFGAEAALATASLIGGIDGVAAFAPTDVVWAGWDGSRWTSHWTIGGEPVPFVSFDPDWHSDADPPAFVDLYRSSRDRFPDDVVAATLPVERIPDVLLVAGGDDRVWASHDAVDAIVARRAQHRLATTTIIDVEAGHRVVLPGEEAVSGGMTIARGGTPEADARLGAAAWPALIRFIHGR
ncbi:acyl-CoA thioester hydrolase/BAAT C-terminal domain-containing protein [Microbacterium gorillae]|uniref:acyl-CoA thioester hydrolase/BAAT C-terminal domain-containing protein n=1 Tax=Microbacterium gorillae TaxID=1231063 RepID=UPI00058E20DA|nr:acyl-CoA thioester hydrolase/BAAT C-terminal domain-containing protein [Microbacterium gorillae]